MASPEREEGAVSASAVLPGTRRGIAAEPADMLRGERLAFSAIRKAASSYSRIATAARLGAAPSRLDCALEYADDLVHGGCVIERVGCLRDHP